MGSYQDLVQNEIKLETKQVFIENVDNTNGKTLLSREKAVKQNATIYNYVLMKAIYNWCIEVKGGMSVDLNGIVAFLHLSN